MSQSSPGAGAPAGGERGARERPGLLLPQANMRRVLYALLPLALAGVYFFGWRVLAVLGVCTLAGLGTEYLTSRQRGGPISTACLVTCALFALSMPPTVPYWMAAVGAAFGILFGKEVFGGFGRNFANPAILGRAFVYVCFPVELTARFVPAFRGWPGGLARWSWLWPEGPLPGHLASAGRAVADAVSQATPMWLQKTFGQQIGLWDRLTGSVSQVVSAGGDARILGAGSIGETCEPLILLAAAYLMLTRTSNWRLTAGMVLGVAATSLLLADVLALPGVAPALFTLTSGGTMFVAVFMITDPVSAPRKRPAQWAYAALAGVLMVLLRWRSPFVASVSFAVLLANLVGPLLDLAAESWSSRSRRQPAPAGGGD